MLTVAQEMSRAGVRNVAPFTKIGMPFSLRDYQVEGLNECLSYPSFGLYFEPRLGKTVVFMLVSIYCAHYGVRTLLIAPPVIHSQLEEEWKSFKDNSFKLHVFSQGPAGRKRLTVSWDKLPQKLPHVLVMTRQIFMKEAKVLASLGFRQVVWDECHMGLQKSNTQIYSWISWFNNLQNSRLILSTGTPIYTTATNSYPIISLTNPKAYPNEAAFERIHVIYKAIQVQTRKGESKLMHVPDKVVKTELLHANLYAYAIRKTRIGNLKMGVPDIAIVDVELGSRHAELYRRLIKEKVLEFGPQMIKATNASKLRQVAAQLVVNPHKFTQPPIKTNLLLDRVEEIINEYPKSERFVLVAHYVSSVETLVNRLKSEKPCVIYGGNTPAKNRREADRFKSGTSKYLVMNADAGGVGLTLGHVASIVIFVEPVSSYGKFDQAVSRVLLPGKKEPVTVYVVRALGTSWVRAVELMMNRSLEMRQVNADPNDLLKELLGNSVSGPS